MQTLRHIKPSEVTQKSTPTIVKAFFKSLKTKTFKLPFNKSFKKEENPLEKLLKIKREK